VLSGAWRLFLERRTCDHCHSSGAPRAPLRDSAFCSSRVGHIRRGFDKRGDDGKKSANARITVVHDGVVIHDNFELPHATPGGMDEKEGEPAGLSHDRSSRPACLATPNAMSG